MFLVANRLCRIPRSPAFNISGLLGGAYLASMVFLLSRESVWGGQQKLVALVLQYLLLLPALLLLFNWSKTAGESQGNLSFFKFPSLLLTIALYLLISIPLAVTVFQGIDLPDESVYLFEARTLLQGRLTTDAPSTTILSNPVFERAFSFDHHVIHKGLWFGKYPPGWPALLAVGVWAKIPWLVNPILGLGILTLTGRLGSMLFGGATGRLACLLLVLSPFFLLNSLGFMSHPACGLALALAVLLAWKGVHSESGPCLPAMIVVLAVAFWVRPFTTFCVGSVLIPYVFWKLRDQRARLARLFFLSIGGGLLLLLLLFAYNTQLSGNRWVTPYALARGRSLPAELSFTPSSIWHNIRWITLYSIGDTLLASFAFIFPLAIFALIGEKEKREECWLLSGVLVSLVVGHLLQTETSTSYIGERYYWEGYFAWVLLGARGMISFVKAQRLARKSMICIASSLLLAQIAHFFIYSRTAYFSRHPYVAVVSSVARLNLHDAVVYMQSGSHYFFPQRLNANASQWQQSPAIYLRDPGTGSREKLTCLLGRTQYVVVAYDDQRQAVHLEAPELVAPCERFQVSPVARHSN